MSKAQAAKGPMKLETVSLKVYIHCEGCKKKVKKIINSLDGVESIAIDADLGKVTVTGTVDSKTLIRKLEKAGKVAELWPNAQGGAGKGGQKNQQKEGKEPKETKEPKEQKDVKERKGGDDEEKGKEKKKIVDGERNEKGESSAGGKAGGNNSDGGDGGQGGGGGGGKKGGKKGGGGGGVGNGEVGGNGGDSGNRITANRSVSTAMPSSVTVQSGGGYTLESADYATHIFSDENANNCSLM